MSSAHVDAALEAAGKGWPVFPCHPYAKTPATEHGFEDATTDPDQIRRWWKYAPKRNVAVATGSAGLVVVDCDVRKGALPDSWEAVQGVTDGLDVLAVLAEREGPDAVVDLAQMMVTLVARTPSGGYHLYFRQADGELVRSSAKQVAPLVDIRAAGGYVVIPPSRTDDGAYAYASADEPAPLPALLARWIAATKPKSGAGPLVARHHLLARPPKPGYAQAALRSESDRVRTASNGTRNDTLVRAAFRLGQLIREYPDVTGEQVHEQLGEAARQAGLGQSEITATITSGLTSGMEKPRGRR